jgi:hypothetical protein
MVHGPADGLEAETMANRWADYSVADLLQLDRVPWQELRRRGVDLQAVADEAGRHGDTKLQRKAQRAIWGA